MSQHVFSIKSNLIVFAILMGLLVLTVVVALAFDLGIFEIPIALTIAMIKAMVIMLYFMHLRYSSQLTWLFAGSGTLFLVILIAFTLSDFMGRQWISPIAMKETPQGAAATTYFGGLPDPDSGLYLSDFETTGEAHHGGAPEHGDSAH